MHREALTHSKLGIAELAVNSYSYGMNNAFYLLVQKTCKEHLYSNLKRIRYLLLENCSLVQTSPAKMNQLLQLVTADSIAESGDTEQAVDR